MGTVAAVLRTTGRAAILAFAGLLAAAGPAGATGAAAEEARWQALRAQLFGDRDIADGAQLLTLEAPSRAHDAAVVPVAVRAAFPQRPERHVRTITLLIDMNPAPVAGRFHFTLASGIADIRTRVRVNTYTHVRAIAETGDGHLYMVSRYVKASGGCSAPAAKDPEAALARLGTMKLRQSPVTELGTPHPAQLLVSHPNSTGMQMDQLTRHYVPAHFVKDVVVSYRGEPVLRVESDISLSEDPSIRFHYVPQGPGELSVEVTDSKGGEYRGAWPVAGGES